MHYCFKVELVVDVVDVVVEYVDGCFGAIYIM